MNDKIIAVTGATGQQGGAVARRLLADGWNVRALTRDLSKPAAQALASAGAELILGDMDSRSELDAAFKGVYGVFSVQNFWLPNVGFDNLTSRQETELERIGTKCGVFPDSSVACDDLLPQAEAEAAPPKREVTSEPAPVSPQPGAEERIRMSRRRRTIAQRLLEASQGTAMLTTFNEIDMSAVMDLRKQAEHETQTRLGPDRWAVAYTAGRTSSIDALLKDIDRVLRKGRLPIGRRQSDDAVKPAASTR